MKAASIRKAQASDAPQLANLSEVLGYPVGVAKVEARLNRLLPKPEHIVLVADSTQNGVVGWTHATEQDILEVGRYCEILGLVVAADQRNQGIARRLVEHVERWAMKRGLNYVSVRSNIVRKESHPFYKRMGYSRIRTQHVYRKSV